MEDDPAESESESEWAIQEYSPYSKQDKSCISTVKWILDNGYGISKNMLITGVAISSTPIVVPPLVVFSAMGYAFSVPFVIVFATYTCTNKIMSTLLPIPPSPRKLEYYEQEKHQGSAGNCRFEVDDDGGDYTQIDQVDDGGDYTRIDEIETYVNEYDDGGGGGGGEVEYLVTNEDVDEERYYIDEEENEEDEFGPENVVEEDNNVQIEDLNQGVDIAFELDEGADDYGKHGEASIMNVNENVNEEINGANENVDENEMEDHVPEREYVVVEEEEKRQMQNIKQGVDVVFDLDEGGVDYENQGEASIMNEDENVDEESNRTTENVDEKEDYVSQLENVVFEEEERKQMEDEIIFKLDEGLDDYGTQGEASIMTVYENADEGSNHANENVDEKEIEDHVVQLENVVIEEEEKEQMKDVKQGVEMRLGRDVSGEDQGYEEDVGEYLEGDDDSFEDESKGVELLIESQIDENNSYTWEVTKDEMQEKVEGGNRLSESMRDEGNVSNRAEDDYLLDESALVFEDARDVEITEPVMVKEIDSQKLITDGSMNNETVVGEMRHIVILTEGNEENNFNVREVEELDLVAREVMGDANKKARNADSDEEVMRESMGTQEEKTGGYTSNDGSKDAIMRTKKEHMIHSYADAREIGDESGLDLFDERNTNIHFTSLEEADDEGKENISSENVDFMALPAFKRTLLATENGKAVSNTKTNTKKPSREDILDEERIWEKIWAMRTIVGYKAPSQPACIGELKALYVFTGVEPPASFKDDSDLNEVNAKLKFLMSIVGVK